MKRRISLSVFVVLLLSPLISVSLRGAEQKPLNIVDYFLLLPQDYFENPPQSWLTFLRQPKAGVVDVGNGYMACIGDGPQPEFEVALFRYRDAGRCSRSAKANWKGRIPFTSTFLKSDLMAK